jgi:hypothetical protein
MVMPRRTLLFAVGLVVASLLIYLLTLAPSVGFTDSGELILAARTLGIPHSPGFPAYVLLGWLFSHLPFGSVAWGLNLMSAVWAALALGAFFLWAFRLLPDEKINGEGMRRGAKKRNVREGSLYSWLDPILAAGCAAWCLAFSVTLWNWATVAEVYTLQVFFLCAMLLALFSALRGGSKRIWASAGLFFGLGLANHHVMTLVFAPALLFLVLSTPENRRLVRHGWLPAAVGVLLGLTLYFYLPIRAAQEPILNWGNPVNLQRLWWHVTGRQYQVNLFSVPLSAMLTNLGFGLRLWWNQFTPAGLLLAVWGLVALWRGERRLAVFSLLVVFVDVAFATHYDIAEDSDAYYLPTFLMTALWIAWGAYKGSVWLRGRGETFAHKRRRISQSGRANTSLLLGYAALTLLVALNLGLHWRQSDKHRLWLPDDYATQVLAELEPDATFLTRDWQVYAPLLYLQHVDGMRPDARIIDVELLRRTWYLDYVKRQYPDLTSRCQIELDAYREQLRLFEYGQPYDAAVIQERYIILLNALLREGQPAHVGLDMEEGVGSDYVGVPLGITVALRQADAFEPFDTAHARGRGLNDGTIHVDAVVKKIRRSYAAVRAYRGVYLMRHSLNDDALQAWSEAAALDPDYSLPYRFAGDLYVELGLTTEARAAYLRALAVNPQDTAAQQGLAAVGGR